MLSKHNKLSKKDIKSLKNKKYTDKKGVFFNNVIYDAPASEKVCAIISKKNIKKANKRNLLRRKIYYIYNAFIKKEGKENKINIIYINKSLKEEKLNNLLFSELRQDLINIF